MFNKNLSHFFQKTLFVLAGLTLSMSALSIGGGGGGDTTDPASEYAENGGHDVIKVSGGSSCTIYRPADLVGDHPIILWGNGTGNSPSPYDSGLSHWASWGFVVAAANTTNAGRGTEMIACLNWLSNSSIRDFLDLSSVGASGHSQGGGGAIMAGRDSRIDATAPFAAYTVGLGHSNSSHSQQSGPMLLLSGSSDFIASPNGNQKPVFDNANVPVFWATVEGAGHSEGSGTFGSFRGISTAWFLYLLTGDNSVADFFEGNNCEFCVANGWDIERKGF